MLPKCSADLRRTIIVLGVAMLFMPKMNLVSIAGESAGIRVDDVLLVVIFALLIAGGMLARKPTMNRIESITFILIGYMLLSNLINLQLFGRSSLLYSLRYFEYFMFFYIGRYFRDAGHSVVRLLYALLFVNASLMLLQDLGVVGGFASAGFSPDVAGRPIGLTGGPWEIGAILNFSLAIFLFDGKRAGGVTSRLPVIACTSVLIVMTGARIPALAHILLISYYLYLHAPNKTYFLGSAAFIGGLLLFAILWIPNPLTERSENIFSTANIELFQEQYSKSLPDEQFQGFSQTYVVEEDTDLSWLIRVARWAIAIKTWTNSRLTWLVGVGPGNWGPALDGGWLRVMSEWGLLGLAIFLVFLYRIAQISRATFALVVALAINMLFIDIHIAYKAMSLFFFLSGYAYHKARANREGVNKARGFRGSFAHAGEMTAR
jgi:hypothetical protein